MTGTARFDSPQSEASQPVEIKLLLHAAGDDLSAPYELVGFPALRVRVVSAGVPPALSVCLRSSGADAFPPSVHLSCERDGERHEVLVGRLPVLLTDQQLALFLRLIRARLEDGDGWFDIERADGGGLIAEGFLSDADRAINRFRSEFKTACHPHDPKQLFPRAQGKLRLATPREFVTWNSDALLAIDNAIVAEEARAITASI